MYSDVGNVKEVWAQGTHNGTNIGIDYKID